MPRFDVQKLCALLIQRRRHHDAGGPARHQRLCQAVEAGIFPKNHKVRWIKSGAAPLAPELARRLTDLTGILVNQGYGMTEASPVTHVGYWLRRR
jgi:acyl-CoA synthetase (AMP-forming)/AMP-acid ligase II